MGFVFLFMLFNENIHKWILYNAGICVILKTILIELK